MNTALLVALLGFLGVVVAPVGPVLVGRFGKSPSLEPDPNVIIPRREYDALVTRMADMDNELHREHVEAVRLRAERDALYERALRAELRVAIEPPSLSKEKS